MIKIAALQLFFLSAVCVVIGSPPPIQSSAYLFQMDAYPNELFCMNGKDEFGTIQNSMNRLSEVENHDVFIWHPSSSSTENSMPPRIGAALISVGNFTYVFGGKSDNVLFDDIWCYDVSQGRWSEITPRSNEKPSARFGMGYCPSPDGEYLWIVGGRGSQNDHDDIWSFSIIGFTWTKLDVQNSKIITPRVGCSCFIFNGYLYLFGGHIDSFPVAKDNDVLNKILYRLEISGNVSDYQWEPVSITYSTKSEINKTLPVSFSSLSTVSTSNDTLIVVAYSGMQLNYRNLNLPLAEQEPLLSVSNLVTIIEINSDSISNNTAEITNKVIKKVEHRLEQVASTYVNNTLFVLGGVNPDDPLMVKNGHNGYNPKMLLVKNLLGSGELQFIEEIMATALLPTPRRNHRAVFSLGRVWVFGGWGGTSTTTGGSYLNSIYYYDPALPGFREEIPRQLLSTTTKKKMNEDEDEGLDGDEDRDDTTRRERQPANELPEGRELFVMEAYLGNLIVFGGKTAHGVVNDVWRYSLRNHHWVCMYPFEIKSSILIPPSSESPSNTSSSFSISSSSSLTSSSSLFSVLSPPLTLTTSLSSFAFVPVSSSVSGSVSSSAFTSMFAPLLSSASTHARSAGHTVHQHASSSVSPLLHSKLKPTITASPLTHAQFRKQPRPSSIHRPSSLLCASSSEQTAMPPALFSAGSLVMPAIAFNLYVFGGVYANGSLSSELWAFHLKERTWQRLSTGEEKGNSVIPREDPRMTYTHEDNVTSLIVAGGVDRRGRTIHTVDYFCLQSTVVSDVGLWRSVQTSGCPISYLGPTIRTDYGFICFPGLNNSQIVKDVYIWEVGNDWAITNISSSEIYNTSMVGGQVVIAADELVAYGGYSTFPNYPSPIDVQDTFFTRSISSFPDAFFSRTRCQPGSFRNNITGKCDLCDYGSFTLAHEQSKCLKCPRGTYLDYKGGSSLEECLPCASGMYNDEVGMRRCSKKCTAAESSRCPPGLTKAEYESPIPSEIKQPAPFQPNNNKNLVYIMYGAAVGAALVFGVTFLCIFNCCCCCHKGICWRKLWKLDVVFTDAHNDTGLGGENREAKKKLKRTSCGGLMLVMMVPFIIVVLVISVIDYFKNNTMEIQTIVLSNPEGDDRSTEHVSLTRCDILIGLVDYDGTCNVDNNKENFTECDGISFRHKNFLPEVNLSMDCKVVDSENRMWWNRPFSNIKDENDAVLENMDWPTPQHCIARVRSPKGSDTGLFRLLADGNNPTVDMYVENPYARTVSIWGRVQIDSGDGVIGERISNYTTTIFPDNNTVFSGAEPTQIAFSIYPSYYLDEKRNYSKFGWVLASSENTLGSMANPPQMSIETGITIQLVLEKSDLFLSTVRSQKRGQIDFLTGLLSNIPTFMSLFGMLLCCVEFDVPLPCFKYEKSLANMWSLCGCYCCDPETDKKKLKERKKRKGLCGCKICEYSDPKIDMDEIRKWWGCGGCGCCDPESEKDETENGCDDSEKVQEEESACNGESGPESDWLGCCCCCRCCRCCRDFHDLNKNAEPNRNGGSGSSDGGRKREGVKNEPDTPIDMEGNNSSGRGNGGNPERRNTTSSGQSGGGGGNPLSVDGSQRGGGKEKEGGGRSNGGHSSGDGFTSNGGTVDQVISPRNENDKLTVTGGNSSDGDIDSRGNGTKSDNNDNSGFVIELGSGGYDNAK